MTCRTPGRARAIGLAFFISTLPFLAADASLAQQDAAAAASSAADAAPIEASSEPPDSTEPAAAAPADATDLSSIASAPTEVETGASPSPSEGAADLQAGSGVQVKLVCTNCNAASLWVNGVSGEHVRVSVDGMPTVSGLGTVYTLAQFPADLVGYTHVTHGPGSVLSGSAAIGGTIEYHTIPRAERKAYLDVQAADDAYHGLKIAGAERWGRFGALVFAQVAEQNHVDANDDDWKEIAAFERQSAQGMFDVHLTENQMVTIEASEYGEDQTDGPGGPEAIGGGDYTRKDEDAFFNWQTYGVRWELNRPSGLRLFAGGRYSRRSQQQWTEPIIQEPPLPQSMTFFIDDEQTSARVQAEVPLARGVLTTGTAWSHVNLQVWQGFAVPQNGLAQFFIIDNLDQHELWAEYARSLGSKWDFSVGARGDRFTVYGRTVSERRFPPPRENVPATDPKVHYERYQPRAQVHFRPNEKVVVGFAAGKGALGPLPAFTETCCGAKYQRSLQLRVEDSWAYQARVEVHPTPDQRISLRLFRTDFDDYQTRAVYKSESYVAYYTRVNVPEARIQGLDLVHDMRFKDDLFNVGWTWTFVDSESSDVFATNEKNELYMTCNGGPCLVYEDGSELPFVPDMLGSAYFRYDDRDRGTKVGLTATYTGRMKHFELAPNRSVTDPWPLLESKRHWSADVDVEQRIGRKGWSAYGGVRNLNDYVQSDLADINRIHDWGPIQGRTVYAGMKFVR